LFLGVLWISESNGDVSVVQKLVANVFNNGNISCNQLQLVRISWQPDPVDNWLQLVVQLQKTMCNRSFVVLVQSYEISKKKRLVPVAVAQKIAKRPDPTGI